MTPPPDIPHAQIRRAARGALRAAGIDANTTLPIPISEVAVAAGLHRDVLLDLGEQEDLPPQLKSIFTRIKGVVLGALSIPEKRIYIDQSVSGARARFTEAHEIGHDALPWHAGAYFGDNRYTLDSHTEAGLETEANLFAAELIFGLSRFSEQADDYRPSIEVPLGLNDVYAASAHSAVRRYVETSRHELGLVIAGKYPSRVGDSLPIWGTYQSPSFMARYGPLAAAWTRRLRETDYPQLRKLFSDFPVRIDECTVHLETTRGKTRMLADGFTNGHVSMVLLRRKKVATGRPIRLVGLDGEPLSVA